MCLIVRSEKEKPLSRALIEEFMKKNSDGWGMMWIQDNVMKTKKSHESKVDDCFNAYNAIKDYNPVLHFRWKTHGKIDHNNTHPFYCGFGIFLMHNGVINGTSSNELSDTGHFVKDWLLPLLNNVKNPHEFIRTDSFREIMEGKIGSNNRVILGDRGGYIIFNEKAWHTCTSERTGIKGVLVSNTYAWGENSFGLPKVTTHYPVTTTQGSSWAQRFSNSGQRGIIGKMLSKRERKRLAKELERQQELDVPPQGFFPGHINEYGVRNHLGHLLDQVVGNIWVNSHGEVWLRWKTMFKREVGLDVWAKDKMQKLREAAVAAPKEENQCSLVHEINRETGEVIQLQENEQGIFVPVKEAANDADPITSEQQIAALVTLTNGHIPFTNTEEEEDEDKSGTTVSIPGVTAPADVQEYESYISNVMKEYLEHQQDIDQLENLCIADGAEAARVIHRLFQQQRYLMN